jgi:3-methylcrotonyl-CoA carboxylase beta subunit
MSRSATNTRPEGDPYYASAQLWDDGIITPAESRRVLAL